MHNIRSVRGTMTHATPWNAQATGETPAPRGSAVGVGPGPLERRPSGRRRLEFRLSLAAGVPTERASRAGTQTDAGTPAAIGPRRETSTRETVDPRRAARGIPNRSLDPAARNRADSPRIRRPLSLRARVESADCIGLELPEARAPGIERDETAIARWKRDEWPRIKKRRSTWRPSRVRR